MTARPSPLVRGTNLVRAADTAPTIAEKRFFKARSLADRLGVSVKTIFRWADAGKLTRHKINERLVLFDVAEADNLIAQARVA